MNLDVTDDAISLVRIFFRELVDLSAAILLLYHCISVLKDERVLVAGPLKCLDVSRALCLNKTAIEELRYDWSNSLYHLACLFKVRDDLKYAEIRTQVGDLKQLITYSNLLKTAL